MRRRRTEGPYLAEFGDETDTALVNRLVRVRAAEQARYRSQT